MPPPLGPSRRQIVDWVDAGIITPEQAVQLMRSPPAARTGLLPRLAARLKPQAHAPAASDLLPPPPSPAFLPVAPPRRPIDRAEFLGPAPRLRDGLAPLRGLMAALVAVIGLIALDTAVVQRTGLEPGALLAWTPLALAAICLVLGLVLRRGRTALLTMALVLPSVLTLIHPAPRTWMLVGPLASCLLILALRLPPARVLLAAPTLAVLLVVLMDAFAGSDAQTILTLLLAGLYVFALGFAVPFESGWRRVPFAVHAILIATVVLAFLTALFGTVLDGDGLDLLASSEPAPLAALLTILVFAGYVAATWFGWRHERARAFQLPSLDVAAVLPLR